MKFSPQPRTVIFSIGLCVAAVFLFLLPTNASARSLSYDKLDVIIQVNEDSTVDITETATIRFVGEYQGVFREVRLNDPLAEQECEAREEACGGFERFALTGVFDSEGKSVPRDQYEYYTLEEEDTDEEFIGVRWTVWSGGREHDGSEPFTWTLKYRLYGALAWATDDDIIALYADAIYGDRNGPVEEATIKIIFPKDMEPSIDAATLYYPTFGNEDASAEVNGNELTIFLADLPSAGVYTVFYPIPARYVQRPARFTFEQVFPFTGINLTIDGIELGDVAGELNSFPAGEHQVVFSHFGFNSITETINAPANGVISRQVSLTPNGIGWILIIFDLAANAVGLILIPFGIIWVYMRWRRLGRDAFSRTVIPLFNPPEGVRPYLLGSVYDERVDQRDITASIIDLAYRGYLKIVEVQKEVNYRLERLDGKKKDAGLNSFESDLLNALFGGEMVVETKDIGRRFAQKYPKMVKDVYREMVSNEYFKRSPEETRGLYAAGGIGLIGLGIAFAIFSSIIYLAAIGLPGFILLGAAMIFTGIGMAIAAPHMPAKTEKGSEVFNHILGFRMYLFHAERYRLQDLTPEEFERYLSYAVAFGIEAQWAENFRDIYKQNPEWFEASDPNFIWDAYWLSRFSQGFHHSMNTQVYNYISSGSGKGSGWSSGFSSGGFGGFSGGGFGGGRGGGF